MSGDDVVGESFGEDGVITIFAVAEDGARGSRAKAKAKSDSLRQAQSKLSPGLRPVRNERSLREGLRSASGARTKTKSKAAGGSARSTLALTLTPKELGEIAEADFLAKASKMGIWVAKPWGDSRRYDFIVDCGGRLRRVQVKSAYREGKDGGYSLRTHGHSGRAYRVSEIDALVGYVAPERAWYVLPVKVVRRLRSLKLYPGSSGRRSKFERYREAWEWLLE